MSHFYFPANDCFFFLSSGTLYIAWRILRSVGVSWKGSTPLFGLDGSVPLSRAWFSGSWSGILYKNVKVGYKQFTFAMLVLLLYEKQNESEIYYMVSSLKRGVSLNLRPRWQNFTQTFLYCILRVFFS